MDNFAGIEGLSRSLIADAVNPLKKVWRTIGIKNSMEDGRDLASFVSVGLIFQAGYEVYGYIPEDFKGHHITYSFSRQLVNDMILKLFAYTACDWEIMESSRLFCVTNEDYEAIYVLIDVPDWHFHNDGESETLKSVFHLPIEAHGSDDFQAKFLRLEQLEIRNTYRSNTDLTAELLLEDGEV